MDTNDLTCYYSDLPSPMAYLLLQEAEEKNKINKTPFSEKDINRIIEMAWEDRTPLKPSNFNLA